MILRKVRDDVERPQDLHRCQPRAGRHQAIRVVRRGGEIHVVRVHQRLEPPGALERRATGWHPRVRIARCRPRAKAWPWRFLTRRPGAIEAQPLHDLLLAQELLPLARVDEAHERRVVRHLEAEALRLAHDGPVQRIDLGARAARQVLPHRRPVLPQRLQGPDDRPEGVLLVHDRHAPHAHHGDDLGAQVAHERHQVFIGEDLAAGEPGDGRRRVHHRVVEQLPPQRVVDVGHDVRLEAGAPERCANDLGFWRRPAAHGGDLDGLDAGAIAQAPWSGMLDAVVRDPAQHALLAHQRADRLGVPDAILQREEERLRGAGPQGRAHRVLGLVRLDGDEHEVERLHAVERRHDVHRDRRFVLSHPRDVQSGVGKQPGARLVHLEQGDVLARAREVRPHEPAQRPGSDDQDPHRHPSRRTSARLTGSSMPDDASRRTTRCPRARPPWPSVH